MGRVCGWGLSQRRRAWQPQPASAGRSVCAWEEGSTNNYGLAFAGPKRVRGTIAAELCTLRTA